MQGVKGFHLLSHLAVHAFQAVDMLFQPQNLFHRHIDFAKRLFHRKRLIPILQEVREFAFGQPQAGVDRGKLDLLSITFRVHIALDLQFTEDR